MIKAIEKTLVKSKGIIEKHPLDSKNQQKSKIIKSKKTPKTPRAIKLISIDIGEKYTKIVEGKLKKDKVFIDGLLKINTPEGAVVEGEIHSKDHLALEIRGAIKDLDTKTKHVVFTSTSPGIICREVIVPFVEDNKELQTLVEYEIQQFLPIDLTEYIVQFSKIDNVSEENIEKLKLFVVIYPKRIAKVYLKLTEEIGLKPYVLDINNNSIKKLYNGSSLISGSPINKEETAFFIDIGAETINITILNRGKLKFMRTILLGGDNLTRAIAKNLEITLGEAEIIKKNEVDLNNIENKSGVLDISLPIIDEWIEEINKVVQFFFNNNNQREKAVVYIYGGSSNLNGLIRYIEDKLGLLVVKVENLDCIELGKNVNAATVEEYLNAIGALIRV